MKRLLPWLAAVALASVGCDRGESAGSSGSKGPLSNAASPAAQAVPTPSAVAAIPASDGSARARLPLVLERDVSLPGNSNRFDYQEIDPASGHLVIAHMNDDSVLVVDARNGSVLKELTGIRTARGVAIGGDVGRIFVTSSPNQLVIIDNKTLNEMARVPTGRGPDGVGWDPTHKMVGVSDQSDGALSLIADAGSGSRRQVPLGSETGNVVFDPTRGWFWITVLKSMRPDQLVAVEPTSGKVAIQIALPGCKGAHGLRLHPDGQSAFVACEDNSVLARVDLAGAKLVGTGRTGKDPDVLSVDPGLQWLYVAAESGDLTVFDIGKPGINLIDRENVGSASHSVAIDPSTHRVFFPLKAGPKGVPVLRIMRPSTE